MIKTKLVILSLLTLVLGGCLGASSQISVQKNEAFNPETKSVITMAVYDSSSKKVATSDDYALSTFQKVIAGKVGMLYGSALPGGDLTVELADKLGIKGDVENALNDLTEVVMQSGSGVEDNGLLAVLSQLATGLNVDAIMFPIASGGKSALENGQAITLSTVLYDARTNKTQYHGKLEGFQVSALELKLANGDSAKLETLIKAKITGAASELMSKIQKDIFPNK